MHDDQGQTRIELERAFRLMAARGGGFNRHLATAWRYAEDCDRRRIEEAFPELVREYTEKADKLEKLGQI